MTFENAAVLYETVTRAPSLTGRTESQLESLIVGKSLRPGDRLPSERELGAKLGVSKTVVREAIRSLAARGLVEVRPGSGTYILGFHREMMAGPMSLLLRSGTLSTEQVHEVREVLEVEIAGLASIRASAKDMEAMEETIEALKAPQISAMEYAEADVAFHQRLAEAAGNPLFSVLANAINDVMIEVRLLAYAYNKSSVERALHYHSWILENVRKRDVEGARRAMEEHLRSSLAVMRHVAGRERLPANIPANLDLADPPERES